MPIPAGAQHTRRGQRAPMVRVLLAAAPCGHCPGAAGSEEGRERRQGEPLLLYQLLLYLLLYQLLLYLLLYPLLLYLLLLYLLLLYQLLLFLVLHRRTVSHGPGICGNPPCSPLGGFRARHACTDRIVCRSKTLHCARKNHVEVKKERCRQPLFDCKPRL